MLQPVKAGIAALIGAAVLATSLVLAEPMASAAAPEAATYQTATAIEYASAPTAALANAESSNSAMALAAESPDSVADATQFDPKFFTFKKIFKAVGNFVTKAVNVVTKVANVATKVVGAVQAVREGIKAIRGGQQVTSDATESQMATAFD
jgi:hypothetical protein